MTAQQHRTDEVTHTLRRQERERLERDRLQIEDDLQRQHERDGGLER